CVLAERLQLSLRALVLTAAEYGGADREQPAERRARAADRAQRAGEPAQAAGGVQLLEALYDVENAGGKLSRLFARRAHTVGKRERSARKRGHGLRVIV